MTETSREITWAGGTHTFDLGHPWVRRVMSYRGLTPAAALARFEGGNYTPEDVERLIELGLIGGGMSDRDAEALLDAHVRGKPLGHCTAVASMALVALFVGAENANA
jgi:hypothetical protein